MEHRTCITRRALGVALAVLALVPGVAAAHGAGAVRGLDERGLRQLESRLLGPGHAAEHAAQRRAARTLRRHPPRRRAPRARAAATGDPARVGSWEGALHPILADVDGNGTEEHRGVMGINAALLPGTGKVLWYSYPTQPDTAQRYDEAFAVLWDPAEGTGAGAFRTVPPPPDPQQGGRPANIWCSGISLLADGRVLVTGGNLNYDTPYASYRGLQNVYTFDPRTERWQYHGRMRQGRWYPSQLLMPDGRTLILQGLTEGGVDQDNLDVELFDPGAPARDVGDPGPATTKIGDLPSWADGEYYPHPFWMPSGRGLIAGPDPRDSWFLLPPGGGGGGRQALGLGFSMQDAEDPAQHRSWGTGVLLPLGARATAGRVMQVGGAAGFTGNQRVATTTAEVFDESTGRWSPVAPLNVQRGHHNTVLLPDGSMVTIGGGFGNDEGRTCASGLPNCRLWTAYEQHKQVEVWDPRTGAWTLGPAQLENRAYHSTALLLPDGSVVSAGDDINGGNDRDAFELYRPAYFHRGDFERERPRITDAPGRVGYGQRLPVTSPDGDVVRATLVAPGATTHAVDVSQRLVELPVSRRGDGAGWVVETPANPDVAPPGSYMLFLVDAAGRPSRAAWVRLDPSAPAPVLPPTEPGPEPGPPPAGPTPPPPGPPGPGGPGPGPGDPPSGREPSVDPPGDTVAPTVRVRVVSARRRDVERRRAIVIGVRLSEAGSARVRVTLKRRRGATSTTLRRWSPAAVTFSRARETKVTLPLTRSERARLRGEVRLWAGVDAIDAAGNRGTRAVTVRVR